MPFQEAPGIWGQGWRLLCAGSDYQHKEETLYLQICHHIERIYFVIISHIILKQRIQYNIFLEEISSMKNEVNILFSFVYLDGHILLLSAKPSPSVFCDLITNGISS